MSYHIEIPADINQAEELGNITKFELPERY